MNTAIGWNPAAPATALRRLQAQLQRPSALAWFERLVPNGSDPWACFEALIAAAMSGTPAAASRAASMPAAPYAPRHDWPSPLPTSSSLAPPLAVPSPTSAVPALTRPRARDVASPPPQATSAALRSVRAGAFAEAAPATPAASPASAAGPAPAAAAATVSRTSPLRAPTLLASPGNEPALRSTGLRQMPSSTPAAPAFSAAAAAAATAYPAPVARVIGWPLPRPRPTEGELPADSKRTRVVEGLPALRQLMQTAVEQSQQPSASTQPPYAPPAMAPLTPLTPVSAPSLARTEPSAPPSASRAAAATDPMAEDALVDRVIDRLDERLREMSIRHLGFTGGLGT